MSRRPVCQTLSKALDIKWYSSGSPRLVNSPSNSIRYNCKKIYCWSRRTKTIRVLARPYLMTLQVIFPIHVNLPITSRFVLRATIHRKNSVKNFRLLGKVFSKRCFYDIVRKCCIWLIFPFYHNLFPFFMFLYLSFMNYFCYITFYTWSFFSIFPRDFPFSSFPSIKYLEELTVFLIKRKDG